MGSAGGERTTEREIKLAVDDLDAIEERLRRLERDGARHEGVEHETNEVLDTPEAVLNGRGELLRLRTVAGQPGTRVTWKGPGGPRDRGLREREEQEYRADDAAACATVFARLGYTPILTYRKERTTWHWRGLSITLDRLEFGTFVEIEVEEAMTAEQADAALAACLEQLGLQEARRVEESYALLQYRWDERQGKESRRTR